MSPWLAPSGGAVLAEALMWAPWALGAWVSLTGMVWLLGGEQSRKVDKRDVVLWMACAAVLVLCVSGVWAATTWPPKGPWICDPF